MNRTPPPEPRARAERGATPTRLAAATFRAKVLLLQLRRHASDSAAGRAPRHRRGRALASAPVLAESASPLWAEDANAAERELQFGKVQNLRVAVRRLDGLEIPAGALFSFWRQVGRTTARKGYARGRELREGCLIPNTGGGLCQLSNALYDAALSAGCEIVERHAHTRVVPGSLAERGRDATVFWNYVDLRWRSPVRLRLECFLTQDRLVVRLRGDARREAMAAPLVRLGRTKADKRQADAGQTGSCASCGVEECFRVVRAKPSSAGFGRAAFLVDEFWPEFDAYVGAQRTGDDVLCLPLDGRRFGRANYAWQTDGFARVRESRAATLRRAWESRRLSAQGAARQRALLAHAERLAESYARRLTYDVTHLVVAQPLLPFLWRGGHLGGRTFDVLATRLPLARLHATLDAARALHPDSPTLGDFRAEEWLVRAEEEALARARKVVTPHTLLAALFPGRAVHLDWHVPPAPAATTKSSDEANAPTRDASMRMSLDEVMRTSRDDAARVVFPAATVARKGVYELRAAAGALGLRLVLAGAQLEGPSFWEGVRVERVAPGGDWLAGARAVVLPSFVEHAPRRLLEAAARGVLVVASTACGLEGMPGVVSFPAGDADALRDALARALQPAGGGTPALEPALVAPGTLASGLI